MESASTPSANEPAKDLSLIRTVQLKPMKKAHFSAGMVSSGIHDVAFPSVTKFLLFFLHGKYLFFLENAWKLKHLNKQLKGSRLTSSQNDPLPRDLPSSRVVKHGKDSYNME